MSVRCTLAMLAGLQQPFQGHRTSFRLKPLAASLRERGGR
jgi:hypothetical protein